MKKDSDPILREIFEGNPCASPSTLAEAIRVAERLPEGCKIVWQSRPQWGNGYWITRDINMVIKPADEPKSCFFRVWENGSLLIRKGQEQNMKAQDIPPEMLRKAKDLFEKYDGSFEKYLGELSEQGFDTRELIDYKASRMYKPDSPYMRKTEEPAAAEPKPEPSKAEPKKSPATAIYRAAASVNTDFTNVAELIRRLRKVGLSPEKILEVLEGN